MWSWRPQNSAERVMRAIEIYDEIEVASHSLHVPRLACLCLAPRRRASVSARGSHFRQGQGKGVLFLLGQSIYGFTLVCVPGL